MGSSKQQPPPPPEQPAPPPEPEANIAEIQDSAQAKNAKRNAERAASTAEADAGAAYDPEKDRRRQMGSKTTSTGLSVG